MPLQLLPGPRTWPSGDCQEIAILPVTQAQLRAILHAEPEHGVEDGLGPWVAFGGYLHGTAVEVIDHEQAPPPRGFVLRTDRAADPRPVLQAFLAALGLRPADLPWIAQCAAVQTGAPPSGTTPPAPGPR